MTPVLSVRDLSIDYRTRRGPVHAVRDVSFDIAKGETVAIIGESGSGKTTLAVSLIRLSPRSARITKGSILYTSDRETIDIRTVAEDELRQYRWSECAMVFQAALNSFNPVINIWEQFADTARAHGMKDSATIHTRANELLDLVHLDPARVLKSYPHELSGGMKQRVLIALSLLLEPQLIILDEPTTALDILTQRAIIDLLGTLRKKLGFSMIFISHDLSIAAELADRMITMYAGTVVERASVTDLFYRPRHPYSVGLLRAVPRVSGAMGAVESIPGSPPDLIRLPPGCTYIPRCPLAIAACADREPDLVAVDTPDHEARCIRWKTVAEQVGTAEVAVAEKIATA
ncbi:MAG TPA: ABC transporter ATP-binding protein [Candidatus Saccharimonadales bacterium]|jgi:peptide/nickel transport system ATP-binding protein|nr:ABC transporter ATP-binding protein [Candidatus Saccharimonadales bacterium]